MTSIAMHPNVELHLLQLIKSHWSSDILEAVGETPIAPEFVAALIANESGGNSNAVRFEKNVFASLAEVILGKLHAFAPTGVQHPLGRVELLDYVEPTGISDFADCLERLAELATSRGLTQIMGWHAVEMSREMPGPQLTPTFYLHWTGELLVYFANHYALDLTRDFEKLFRCWNTGKPDGVTFDPHYVENGLRRIDLYRGLGG